MKQRKTINKISSEQLKELVDFLNSYDCDIVNQKPCDENVFWDMLFNYTISLYNYTRNCFDSQVFAVANEIRALLGHMSDYAMSLGKDRRNFEKAYGHFRRINLDLLKILCDEFDKAIALFIDQCYKFDLRNVDSKFLETLLTNYVKAKEAYIDAQKNERVGSDSDQNIIELYFTAAKGYGDTLLYYIKNKDIVKKAIKKARIKSGCSIAYYVVSAIVGVLLIVL